MNWILSSRTFTKTGTQTHFDYIELFRAGGQGPPGDDGNANVTFGESAPTAVQPDGALYFQTATDPGDRRIFVRANNRWIDI